MSGYTPGPWSINANDPLNGSDPVVEANAYPDGITTIAVITTRGRAGRNSQVDANAQLIAAAPLLLDALETLLGVGGHYDACFGGAPYYRRCEPICAQARAAVLAAKGVQS